MIDLNKFAKEVHENAVKHGWWDAERSFGEVIALIHSELSEALEEYRNGHKPTETYYSNGGKPEGIPSELADVVIRVLDWCGHEKIEIDETFIAFNLEILKRLNGDGKPTLTFAEGISAIHTGVSNWYQNRENDFETSVVSGVYSIACDYKIDLESSLLEKHEYNKTRPYKHGGKII